MLLEEIYKILKNNNPLYFDKEYMIIDGTNGRYIFCIIANEYNEYYVMASFSKNILGLVRAFKRINKL